MHKDNRWSLTVTKWISKEGKCGRVQQKVRRADEVNKFAGKNWSQLAQDWDNLRSMGEAFAVGVDRLMMMMMKKAC